MYYNVDTMTVVCEKRSLSSENVNFFCLFTKLDESNTCYLCLYAFLLFVSWVTCKVAKQKHAFSWTVSADSFNRNGK